MKSRIKGGTSFKGTSSNNRTMGVPENDFRSNDNNYSPKENVNQDSNEGIRMKSGDSSEISANGAEFNYDSDTGNVEFTLETLRNESDGCTGTLKIICWVSQYRYNSDNGGFQNDNYDYLSESIVGWLRPGEEFENIHCEFNIDEELKKTLEDMDEWHFIFTINESNADGKNYIVRHFNTDNQMIGALLKFDDDSIIITADSEDSSPLDVTVYRDGLEYSGRLESRDGDFLIGFENGRVTYMISYHENGVIAEFISVEINNNGEFEMYETFYNNSKVELSEAKFNLFYGKRNDRIIKEGIAELQSHIRVISPSNEDDEPETEYHNDKRSIQDRVFSIIIDKLTLEPYEVSMNSNLMSDLGADSLDTVELIMEMEKEFGIIIPDEDAEMIRTVGDIVRYIENIIS